MKYNYLKYLMYLLVMSVCVSCSKDNILPDPNNYVTVDRTDSYNSLFNVEFYSVDSLFVGYNKVYFKVTEKSTGNIADQATIDLHPVMDMVTMKHACPVENPDVISDSFGYFKGAIIFSMPGSGNSWSLKAIVTVNSVKDSVFFDISKVAGTSPAKKIVVIDSLSNGPGSWIITKYPVSIVEPDTWKVGNNTFEVTIHKMASGWSFPCCTDFTVEITPEMPSMGHASPNNVNPVLTNMGHYVGTVNFTMTGAWRVNMVFKKEGRTIGRNAWFDINV